MCFSGVQPPAGPASGIEPAASIGSIRESPRSSIYPPLFHSAVVGAAAETDFFFLAHMHTIPLQQQEQKHVLGCGGSLFCDRFVIRE